MRWTVLLLIVGCAPWLRGTVHDYCAGDGSTHYRDYDQCYAEVSRMRSENDKHASALAKTGSDAMTQSVQSPRTTTCHEYLGGVRCETE